MADQEKGQLCSLPFVACPLFSIKKAFDYLIKKCKSEIGVIINLHQDLQGDIISAFRQLLL